MIKPQLILTFDLEFWYNSEFLKNYLPKDVDNLDDKILESTLPLLTLLKKHQIKATFFVLGQVAEKYPELIKKIHQDGHEIASHDYSHKVLNELKPKEFEEEIKKSVNLLKKITGENPLGFRAPNFSLTNQSRWAIPVLGKYGFKYDSSIFPVKTKLYGNSRAPLYIYKISKENILKEDKTNKILELPVATYEKFKIRIPSGGGFYFRIIPIFLYKKILEKIAKKRIPVIYLHPHELSNFVPDIKIPFFKKKMKYWGVHNSLNKLEKLLKDFKSISISEYLDETGFKA